jgi:two-component sensor histidine kinase
MAKRTNERLRRQMAKLEAENVTLRAARDSGIRQDSEAHWRSIFEHMHEGFALCQMVYSPDGTAVDFRYIKVNRAWERLTNIPLGETVGRVGSEVFPNLERFWTGTYAQVVETGEPAHFEHRIATIGQWFEVFAYRTEPGCFAALFLNVTKRKANEERLALLATEVDHRAKNALTMVQAMLRLTKADDLSSYRRDVEGRVAALARAQNLLTANQWKGAELRVLLETELSPFLGGASGPGPRATLEGPQVQLSAEATQPLAMAVHELATNAVKHGALSAPSGRVSISWSIERSLGQLPLLRLRWTETEGPLIASKPERRGFGSRVLERTINGQLEGAVSMAWETSGLVCELEVPLKPSIASSARPDPSTSPT